MVSKWSVPSVFGFECCQDSSSAYSTSHSHNLYEAGAPTSLCLLFLYFIFTLFPFFLSLSDRGRRSRVSASDILGWAWNPTLAPGVTFLTTQMTTTIFMPWGPNADETGGQDRRLSCCFSTGGWTPLTGDAYITPEIVEELQGFTSRPSIKYHLHV